MYYEHLTHEFILHRYMNTILWTNRTQKADLSF